MNRKQQGRKLLLFIRISKSFKKRMRRDNGCIFAMHDYNIIRKNAAASAKA